MKNLFFPLLLTLFGAVPALASPAPDPVRLAALEVRVGEFPTALKLLEAYVGKTELDRSAHRLVEARAFFGLGRHDEALQRLDGVTAPALRHAAAWLRFQVGEVLGDDQMTLKSSERLKRLGTLPPRYEARRLLAIGRIGLLNPSRASAARTSLRRLVKHRDRSVRARALALLADEGDLTLMARLLVEYPDSEEARRRAHWMKRVGLSLEQRRDRAEELFRFRAYDLAAPEYEALARSDDAVIRQKAHLRRATIQMRMREGYEISRGHLLEVVKGPDPKLKTDAMYRLGLVLGHQREHDAGRDMMRRFISESRPSRRRMNARYQVGRLMHEAGRYEESLVDHRAFLKTGPRDRAMWTWFEAWTLFRSGRYSEARVVLQGLSGHKNLLVGAKALYWLARCHRLEGNHDDAEAVLIELNRRAPLSYYGLLGSTLRGQIPPRRIPRVKLRSPLSLGAWSRRLAKSGRGTLEAVSALVRVGEVKLARHLTAEKKLRRAIRRLPRHMRAEALDQLDLLLENWGNRWKVLPRKTRRVPWREGLAEEPARLRSQAYPPAYFELARAAGRSHDVSPWWLIAHMLQESRYKERARSHAVALGTMQILPRTGRRIADRLGFPNGDFRPDQLFEAGVGLRQAAWYLSALRREFHGNTVLAIAAYNGGPRRVAQHVQTMGDVPHDVLIEEIGAHETRNYVRKVTDHLVRHLDMYADDAERARILKSLVPADAPARFRGELRF